MRIPLTPHGTRELLLFTAVLALLAWGAWAMWPPLVAVPSLLFLFLLSFFRDPERTSPDDPVAAVALADGKVTDIGEVDEPHVLGGRALRIGIFLSVFDVHVNRAPLDGTVTRVLYAPGKFLDARRPECVAENEANLSGFTGPRGPFAVRQVAGLISRRIVSPMKVGDRVARGQRMGMIKFGSRTELLVPADAPVEVAVKVGQRVRGAETVLLRYRA